MYRDSKLCVRPEIYSIYAMTPMNLRMLVTVHCILKHPRIISQMWNMSTGKEKVHDAHDTLTQNEA
jgi:hypothetical protein